MNFVKTKVLTKKQLNNNYSEFLDNLPKVSDASKAAMEAYLTLEELQATMKSKGMKDTAPGPDGIPYSVYGKLWATARPLVLEAWKYSNAKGELRSDQLLSTIMFSEKKGKNTAIPGFVLGLKQIVGQRDQECGSSKGHT